MKSLAILVSKVWCKLFHRGIHFHEKDPEFQEIPQSYPKPPNIVWPILILFAMVGTVMAECLTIQGLNREKHARETYYCFDDSEFMVIHGTTAVKLDEFVSSGKLCEFRGNHEWSNDYQSSLFVTEPRTCVYKCKLCHRCRKRVKVSREVEEWER